MPLPKPPSAGLCCSLQGTNRELAARDCVYSRALFLPLRGDSAEPEGLFSRYVANEPRIAPPNLGSVSMMSQRCASKLGDAGGAAAHAALGDAANDDHYVDDQECPTEEGHPTVNEVGDGGLHVEDAGDE